MKITPIEKAGWEKVARAEDPESGLLAFIAVHDSTLGPALGGMRLWAYENEDAALTDVLRLSRGMTFKSSVARTGLGGGKSVIIAPASAKTPELFQAMGRFVESFGGKYTTAEDVNVGIADLLEVHPDLREDPCLFAGVKGIVDRLLDARQQGLSRRVEAKQMAVLGEELTDGDIPLSGSEGLGRGPPLGRSRLRRSLRSGRSIVRLLGRRS